ncbi:hypothetical protein F4820DRAFT_428603 [Hypoxylon rubiginosum]|uniref:Uncharacterized protein n=1 Tax=Hypoxylon rubiginosum TaxID=110542 RepID=A0ACB9YUV2_9PEZI|nr:hypothetical protein F4820DRAFT_428603 [Hypoxylon rubiginosum]
MPTKEAHAVLSWTPADDIAAAHLDHFRSVPWLADIISLDGVRPYTADLLAGVTTATQPGCDPVLDGILARDGGVSRHICLLAGFGILPPVGRQLRERGAVDPSVKRGNENNGEKHYLKRKQIENVKRGKKNELASKCTDRGERCSGSNARKAKLEGDGRVDESPFRRDEDDDFPIHLDILTLGPALQGIPHTTHGGVLTMLIDATCGRVGFMHRDPRGQTYSAYTNVRFLRPIIAPSTPASGDQEEEEVTVLVRTQISAKETRGGKMIIRASVEGDGGVVYAVGESMVVEKVWKGKL